MPQDTQNPKDVRNQQSGTNNPTHGSDQGSFEKKGEQNRQNQPGQQAPKKDVQGEERKGQQKEERKEEHQKTGTR